MGDARSGGALPKSTNVHESGHDPLFHDLRSPAVVVESTEEPTEPRQTLKFIGQPKNIDHLGLPIRASGSRQKFKYARTYTIMYDSEREADVNAENEVRVVMRG